MDFLSCLSSVELNKTFQEDHLVWLAPHFGSPLIYIEADGFNLTPAERSDVTRQEVLYRAKAGMTMALKLWLKQNPFANPRALLEIMHRVGAEKDLISNMCEKIKTLKVSCDNLKNGCQWKAKLGELEEHLKLCDYAIKECPNRCTGSEGKQVTMLSKEIKIHLSETCPYRDHKCIFCKDVGKHKYITTEHLNYCSRKRVTCPNEGCTSFIQRCNIKSHRSTCRFEKVSCKYLKVGCEEKPQRRNLKEHEENDQLHLRVTTEKVLDLTKKYAILDGKVAAIMERERTS